MHCKNYTRHQASDYLRHKHNVSRSPSTLAKMAVQGGGPAFRRVGRKPLYSEDDLDAWVEAITSPKVSSTSELNAA